ncbi:dynein regulatory complex protein 1 [Pempheris klunzingeri]|uniref:dynein regulatory complex protein 1 n=1 Tax=Pempheris klunzingeri TaxID=3127111 RepID=UPI0039800686
MVSTQDPSQPQEEEGEQRESGERIINLQRDLQTLVTNIQTAVDAKESMRRTDLEEACRFRLERLETDVKSSQEKFEEISKGWSIAKQKVIPQELQEALNNQQKLCTALIDDKKQLINDLQQELKVGDDRYVKDLRRQAEELDLMMERMEEQMKTLTKAYREELAQMERVYQEETEVLLTRDKTDWDKYMKELWDKELVWLTERQKKVKEYEATIHSLMLDTNEKFSYMQTDKNSKLQALVREHQQLKATTMITNLKLIKPKNDSERHTLNLDQMKSRIYNLSTEVNDLLIKIKTQKKQMAKSSQSFYDNYQRSILQYEDIQKKMKHSAVADARKIEKMWLMVEAEVKQLVEKALLTDSLICRQPLGVAWKCPPAAFMGLSSPIQPQKRSCQDASQLFQTGQCSQKMADGSVGPGMETDDESTDGESSQEGAAAQSEDGAEVDDGKLTVEIQKAVMELLCDEAVFLMEDELLTTLAPLEREEQYVVKLGFLLDSFGIEAEDLPKLANFLYEYNQRQQREQALGASGESSEKDEDENTDSMTFERIDPIYIIPALKIFLEQLMRSKQSSARQRFQHILSRDTSEDEVYWNRMGNIISEDRVKLWDAAEITLKQYHAVLTEITELLPETQSLQQQNTELRRLLQQSINSGV